MPKEIDEDLIEATIRRVAESAARASAPAIEMPVAESVAPVYSAEEEEARAVSAAAADAVPDEADTANEPEPEAPIVMPRLQPREAAVGAQAWSTQPAPAAATDEVLEQLREIGRRLDAIQQTLEMFVGDSTAIAVGGEWDRASQTRAQIVMPQRPTIVRESSPSSEAEVIDTRPLPKPLPPIVEPKRGFDLLPRTYRITVEDKRRGVDLVPLHRAMLGMVGVRDMSLLSYSNGTAIVALETEDELDPELVRVSMQQAMQRDARVEVHNESTMVVKLTPED